jgi:hypothetical protein
MSTENAAPAGGDLEPAPVVGLPNLFEAGAEDYSPEQAAREYESEQKPPAESAEAEKPATPEKASEAKAEDAAPDEGTTVEDEGTEPELPAIDLPKSWSKDAQERWSKLDRDTQEFLAARDSEAQKAIKRSLNEAAEARKAAEAEIEQSKQARTQYEAKQAAYTNALEEALQSDFGDIRTLNDVRKLQAEDPFRFQQWQLRQMELSSAQTEKQANEQRSAQEKQSKRITYQTEQAKLLSDALPELADPKAHVEMQERAVKMLTDELDLPLTTLQRWMADDTGHEILNSSGLQRLIATQIKLQQRIKQLEAAPPKAIPKPVPAVQKPGVAVAKNAAAAESIQALRNKLDRTGSVEDAFALYQAENRRRA